MAANQQSKTTLQIRIAACSYNVKNKSSTDVVSMPLENWLLGDKETIDSKKKEAYKDVDIYAVGFQEVDDPTIGSIIDDKSLGHMVLQNSIQKILTKVGIYKCLISVELQKKRLYIFIKECLFKYVANVSADAIDVSPRTTPSSKGAVFVRFLLHSTSFAFTCSHLTAFENRLLERNKNYFEIAKNLSSPYAIDLHSHDYVIWLGDLNYRLEMPKETAEKLAVHTNWPELLKYDQLERSREPDGISQDYQEANITFLSQEQRVLVRKRKKNLTYNSIYYGSAKLRTSDHRPVILIFDIDVLPLDESKIQVAAVAPKS
ncbi:hypothetical protein QYM36_012721 [Artemia franciscana]|uniref:Inositol polyphosphate-related phosphatase domain-containing protein n=1 Tax=Artemia franciscana TaxID=6661 RepID=A0AA88KXZ4_ARTSF|nr:hypothetical protein QYM36_012721 [Artemia franciscana]